VSGALRHALLGLLSQERASGYELARRFERTLWRDAWHAQYSQIRPELDRMAIDGLITVVATGARRRRTYSITRAGQAELQRWLRNPPGRFVVRSEFVLRLFLLSTLDPADARSLLAPIADATAQELATRRAAVATTRTSAGASAPLSFDRLAAEFSVRSVEALHEWARWALAELDR
jgi:PadR family transcriptional regulator, regulatory protein AphA